MRIKALIHFRFQLGISTQESVKMGLFCSKPDEKHKQIVDLPPEIMEKILCYIPKEERMKSVSLVKKQWYFIINSKIEEILIRQPNEENLNQVRNLINRFPRMKKLELNVVLATAVDHCLDFLPLTSLAFFGIQLEFNFVLISWKLEHASFKGLLFDLRKHGDANITDYRIKVRKQQPATGWLYSSIVKRIGPNFNYVRFGFSRNLDYLSLWLVSGEDEKFWIKVFDVPSNIETVRVVGSKSNNVVGILKNLIRALKGLKSLHFVWDASDETFDYQLNDCYNFIKENFPLESKVMISTFESNYEVDKRDVLTNLIVKEEGKSPKIVTRGSPGSIITWHSSFWHK